jgi:hypothetical protein
MCFVASAHFGSLQRHDWRVPQDHACGQGRLIELMLKKLNLNGEHIALNERLVSYPQLFSRVPLGLDATMGTVSSKGYLMFDTFCKFMMSVPAMCMPWLFHQGEQMPQPPQNNVRHERPAPQRPSMPSMMPTPAPSQQPGSEPSHQQPGNAVGVQASWRAGAQSATRCGHAGQG